MHYFSFYTAYHTVIFLLIRNGRGAQSCLPLVLKIVINLVAATSQHFQSFSHACCGYESVGRSNGWDDVLHDTHCQLICHALNAKPFSTDECLLIDPGHIGWRIFVYSFFGKCSFPFNCPSILNAMLWKSRCLTNCAHWISSRRGQRAKSTFITSCLVWYDNSCLT